ncbi:TPR repeat protein [Arachis hypogaea]|nr:TPR repeat protein [Arachis hypogaea]
MKTGVKSVNWPVTALSSSALHNSHRARFGVTSSASPSHLRRRRHPVTSVAQSPPSPSHLCRAAAVVPVAQPVISITWRRCLPSPTLPIACSALEALKVPSSFQEFQSLVEFDRAIELDPRQKAYLWQRGLSLYYLDRFEEGAEQFRLDVAQNPNDTEESIWCFLCETQLYGVDEARKRYLEVSH